MKRKEKIKFILRAMEDQLEDILDATEFFSLSPEECIGLSMELTINNLSNAPKTHKQQSVTIDKHKVLFMLDEQTAVPIFEEYYEEVEDDEDNLQEI